MTSENIKNSLRGKIEINNLTNLYVDKKLFLGVAKKVLKGENKEMENLSIAFVDSAEIKKINKKYRKKDEPTDVLSFNKSLNFKEDFSEIIICPEIVKKNAEKSGMAFKKKLAEALIHGILHNLGYDHEASKSKEKKMSKKQDYYISKL